jgi:pseudaminic acid synthase
MKIAGREIGADCAPYLIAEMSGNHNQSIDRAFEIVKAAAASGADAIKLQTYTAATMTLDCHAPWFVINDQASLWNGRRLFDLYHDAHTPWEWHAPIMSLAKSLGMACFSTPFDESAVDFLESLGVEAYKIASFELTDHRLIRRVASTGKPIVISTGMASVAEIDEAIQAVRGVGGNEIVLLKCTSTYPASPGNSNLRTIPVLRETFGCHVGLSDHTMGTGVSVAAVALGAVVIEKHLTLDRSEGGVDSDFSMEPREFAQLRTEADRAWVSLGSVTFGGTKAESASKNFRRSIFVSEDIKAGEMITVLNVRIVRPSTGLEPRWFDQVLGRVARSDIAFGTPLSWDLLS